MEAPNLQPKKSVYTFLEECGSYELVGKLNTIYEDISTKLDVLNQKILSVYKALQGENGEAARANLDAFLYTAGEFVHFFGQDHSDKVKPIAMKCLDLQAKLSEFENSSITLHPIIDSFIVEPDLKAEYNKQFSKFTELVRESDWYQDEGIRNQIFSLIRRISKTNLIKLMKTLLASGYDLSNIWELLERLKDCDTSLNKVWTFVNLVELLKTKHRLHLNVMQPWMLTLLITNVSLAGSNSYYHLLSLFNLEFKMLAPILTNNPELAKTLLTTLALWYKQQIKSVLESRDTLTDEQLRERGFFLATLSVLVKNLSRILPGIDSDLLKLNTNVTLEGPNKETTQIKYSQLVTMALYSTYYRAMISNGMNEQQLLKREGKLVLFEDYLPFLLATKYVNNDQNFNNYLDEFDSNGLLRLYQFANKTLIPKLPDVIVDELVSRIPTFFKAFDSTAQELLALLLVHEIDPLNEKITAKLRQYVEGLQGLDSIKIDNIIASAKEHGIEIQIWQ